jgi:hypothetical protein
VPCLPLAGLGDRWAAALTPAFTRKQMRIAHRPSCRREILRRRCRLLSPSCFEHS